MRILLIALLLCASVSKASPIVYTDQSAFAADAGATSIYPVVTGAVQCLGGSCYLSLKNPGSFVLLTFSEPLYAFGAYFDNRPLQPGTGNVVTLSNGSTLPTFANGYPFVGFWGVQSDSPFAWLRVDTLAPFTAGGVHFITEHETIWDLVGSSTPPESSNNVPEGGTVMLGAIGLFAIWCFSMCRVASKPVPAPDQLAHIEAVPVTQAVGQ